MESRALLVRALSAALLTTALVVAGGCSEVDGTREAKGSVRETSAPRVILIGIDGASWNLIDPLLEAGELPNLDGLRMRGVTGELEAVEPVLSPAVWTSIATGRSPEAHGVTFFFAESGSIRTPTVWDRLAAKGLRIGLHEYLVTWPPPELPGGFVIPGWLRRDHSVWPADLFDRLGLPPSFYEVLETADADEVLENSARELREKPRYWNRLVETFDPDVGAVSLYAVDVISHRFYHTARPHEMEAPPPVATRHEGALEETYRRMDRALGEILAGLEPEDRVVVVSDHGFQALPERLRRWAFDSAALLDRGDIAPERDGVMTVSEWISLTLKIEPVGSAGADGEIRDRREREEVLARIENLLQSAQARSGEALFEVTVVRDPETVDEDVLPPWMVRRMEGQGPAHAFVFARPVPEVMDRVVIEGEEIEVLGSRHDLDRFAVPNDFTGHHLRTGVFMAAGDGIRHVPERIELSVLDVAPLLVYLADQPIPSDLEGELPIRVLDRTLLRRNPPRTEDVVNPPAQEGDGAIEDEELKERLRALGYLG